jgi:hypothetical protein
MWFDQASYDVRLEWGAAGLGALLAVTDVVVIRGRAVVQYVR